MSKHAEPASETPPFRYTAELADQIENHWQERWAKDGTYAAPNPSGALAPAPGTDLADRVQRPKLMVMDMFPYPSGVGLHVGHPLGYIGTDAFARFKRMTGYNVMHPFGYDAFGLPAEQYAVQTGQHPKVTTDNNIATMGAQLRRLGLGHDPNRTFATTDPEYYRWTQWIFLQIFNSWYDEDHGKARPIADLVAEFATGARNTPDGSTWNELTPAAQSAILDEYRLAYSSEAPVNWAPGLGTVLANEEVTADNRSERGNFPVFKRSLRQWMMRITAYADRLLDDLDLLDWPEPIKLMQRNWIGRSAGARVHFPAGEHSITVFTTRPDTIFGCNSLVLAPEHPLVDTLTAQSWPAGTKAQWIGGAQHPAAAVAAYRQRIAGETEQERTAAEKPKTGVFTGSYATNPVSGAQVPIFIADYVLTGYGTGAVMGVPGEDSRDWAFSEVFELPIVRTVAPPEDFSGTNYEGDGVMINSANADIDLNGLPWRDAKEKIIEWLADTGRGERAITYKLRDWLFSRQRYWGEPFPIVYDDNGVAHALPDSMLPVRLPELDDYSPRTFAPDDVTSEPEPPLARNTEWVNVTLDLGDGPKRYRRETNTMPNWAGSCWYELRYLDPTNTEKLVDPEIERYWLGPRAAGETGGVDLYVGGVEHAVLHLLYARFWHKVLHDLGHVSSSEPFHRLFNQGYIQASAYTDSRGAYVPAEEVVEVENGFEYNGQPVNREYGKMGKSLKNMVTPDEMCARYGADTFRVYEMSMGPLDASRPWETRAVVGSFRFLQRVWRTMIDEQTNELRVTDEPADLETRRLLHRTIDGARGEMDELRFNTAVSKLIELTNHVTQRYGSSATPREVAENLTLMLAPFAPHMAEELWQRLGHANSLVYVDYPVADPELLVGESIEYPVQVNGKLRAKIVVAADADSETVTAAALAEANVQAHLGGKPPRKVIVVPNRIVTIVAG